MFGSWSQSCEINIRLYFLFLFFFFSLSLGAHEVEAALERMIDRCQSGGQGSKASTEELGSVLGLTDGQTAATICGLYAKVEAFSTGVFADN